MPNALKFENLQHHQTLQIMNYFLRFLLIFLFFWIQIQIWKIVAVSSKRQLRVRFANFNGKQLTFISGSVCFWGTKF
jgi:hypothetical protein